ncbi:hypothetical protein ACQ4PT_009361 [Festuca glaucescens]
MPPPRTRRYSLRRSAAEPYCGKAKDRGIKKDRQRRKVGGGSTESLSDDALARIFAGLSDAADLVRCAVTCRRWGRVVATSAAIVSRSMPPLGRFLPDLAVGLFHRETELPAAASPLLPCFVPMASAARFLGAGQQRLLGVAGLGDGGGILHHSRPVASRNGRLVLELQREGRAAADGLRLVVCNPMMMRDNSIVLVPPLISIAGTMQDYGCALFTGQDLHPPRCNTFFRLLLVYNSTGNSTVLRCYSSDTGCWGREAECNVQISSSKMCDIGQAVVRCGVAFWALDPGVLGARLDQIDQHGAVMDMHLVPYQAPHFWPNNRLLGISPDNRLFFMTMGVTGMKPKFMLANLSYFKFEDEDNICSGRQLFGPDREDQQVRMPEFKLSHYNMSVKLRWFGEKSGLFVFTMGRPSGHRGTFVLNLHDKVFSKVADYGDSWKNLLGYEMDMAAYLSSVNPRSQPEKPSMPSIWRFSVCRTTGTRYITLEHS